ncbi:MAG: hypothetical protein AAFQ68_24000 [Bacteroidota bacterium]
MEEQIIFERIEAYYHDRLSAEEREVVAQKIAQDPLWRQIFHQQQEMEQALNDPGAARLEAGFAELFAPPLPFYKRIPMAVYGAAAAIALLLAIIWGLNQTSLQTDYQALAMAQFEPYPSLRQMRGVEAEDSALLSQALLAYDQKNYAEAIQLFSRIEDSLQLIPARFYAGNVHLIQGQAQDAVLVLEPLTNMPDHPYLIQSQWYLALAYLQLEGQAEQALSLLEKVAQTPTEFGQRAKELLQQIRSSF